MRLLRIYKSFDNNLILNDINLDLGLNGIVFLSGQSGSGKTTLLNIIAGLDQPTHGHITDPLQVSMILQDYPLLERLSVLDNICLGQTKLNRTMRFVIKKLELKPLLDQKVSTLSAGQKQRVAIARTLIYKPDILLCDEPTASLDKTNKQIVMELLVKLAKKHPVVIASHDQQLIDTYANALYTIKDTHLICDYDHRDQAYVHKTKRYMVKPRWKKLVFKYHWFRSLLFSLIITIMSMVALWLYHSLSLQLQPPTMQQRFSDSWMMIFNVEDLSVLHGPNTKSKDDDWLHGPIFANINLKPVTRNFKGRVLPLPTNADLDQPLSSMGLVANTLCGISTHSPLTMHYTIDKKDYEVTMVVETIVDEPKSSSCVYYYDASAMDQYLKDQSYDDTTSQYDRMMQTNLNWFLQTVRLPMIEWNLEMGENQYIDTISVYMEERDAFETHVSTYRMLFDIITIIVTLLLLGLTMYGFNRLYRYDLSALSLLCLYSISLTKIKCVVLTMDILWMLLTTIMMVLPLVLFEIITLTLSAIVRLSLISSVVMADTIALIKQNKKILFKDYQTMKGNMSC